MKFEIGDKVKVTHAGSGFGEDKMGYEYTIRSSAPDTYFGDEGYQVNATDINPHHDGWVGVRSFTLIEGVSVLNSLNVKMITTFVPAWAKWMAMSSFGVWHVYADRPRRAEGTWDSCSSGSFVAVGRCGPKDITVDWKETLHEI